MRLEGRVAIITGAGQGIGKAYARRFLQEGAKVAIAELNEERGKAAVDDLSELGEVMYVPVDVSDRASADAMAAQVNERWGSIDVLINNAAIYYDLDIEDRSYEYLQKVMSVNMFGVWIASAAVAPYMIRQGRGKIINQSSIGAFIYLFPGTGEGEGLPSQVGDDALPTFNYSWAKWGVIGLTRFMAGSLGPKGINVNCICPGETMTEATKKVVPQEVLGMLKFMTALKKSLEPEDLAGTAVYFASDDSDFVTGQTICVDAGFHMG